MIPTINSSEKDNILNEIDDLIKKFNNLKTSRKTHVKIIKRDVKDNVFTEMMNAAREQHRTEEFQKTFTKKRLESLKNQDSITQNTTEKLNVVNGDDVKHGLIVFNSIDNKTLDENEEFKENPTNSGSSNVKYKKYSDIFKQQVLKTKSQFGLNYASFRHNVSSSTTVDGDNK